MKKSLLLQQAINLRKQGVSLGDISTTLGISRSTASLWVKNVSLSQSAKQSLLQRQIVGREKGRRILLQKGKEKRKSIENSVDRALRLLTFSKEQSKALCALLYACEGSKREKSRVVFINSDPELIRFFLTLFRSSL